MSDASFHMNCDETNTVFRLKNQLPRRNRFLTDERIQNGAVRGRRESAPPPVDSTENKENSGNWVRQAVRDKSQRIFFIMRQPCL